MDKTAWFVVTSCLVLLGINFWYNTQNTPPPAPPAATAAADPAATPADPTTPLGESSSAPAAPAPAVAQEIASLTSRDADNNEVARFHFQNVGGSIRSIEMLGKAINSTKPELQDNVQLNSGAGQERGIGTLLFALSESAAPQFDSTIYSVVPELTHDRQVTLEGKLNDLTIRKTYTLKPLQGEDGDSTAGNAYCLHLRVDVQNNGSLARRAQNWGIYAGAAGPISDAERTNYTYYIRLEDNKFKKESAGSFKPFFGSPTDRLYTTSAEKIGWGGVMNQYYATLLRPTGGNEVHAYYAAPLKHMAIPGKPAGETEEGVEFGVGVPEFTLAAAQNEQAGGTHTLEYDLFAGPKLNLMLNGMTKEFPKLDHIMDYGIFHLISYSMNWLINIFYRCFGNWGWAIVAMTIVVRLLIWPLYRKSYTSMKSMSLLQPKIAELREKYGNDQQRLATETMQLYRDYGVSPAGGCLPMLLQIPIFFSFFYVLQTAAEFRGAPFIAWVTDLSQMDTIATLPILGYQIPINILPIIMALSMYIQMSMTPQTGDAMQQRIMRLMPIFFFAFCYTYPSALALYWTTTNIISIIQTQIIRRLPQPELHKQAKKRSNKKGFFERMLEANQAALAEQQRRQQQQQQRK
ncbi:MAG: membrane protein insertase YidC [Akkermansiaceae bacterium]|nr:membrane protein insertase YidC [Akkermansiaceae bacterium]